MPHLDLDGGFRLYYERHGEGPPVVFAHGAGGMFAAGATLILTNQP